jgi:hypothetical protein
MALSRFRRDIDASRRHHGTNLSVAAAKFSERLLVLFTNPRSILSAPR